MFRCASQGTGWIKSLQSKAAPSSLSAMSVTSRRQHGSRHSSKRTGPDPRIQLPQLPKQLEGKFVRGQMYTKQDSLPKLPVPPLEQTLKKYIKGIKHLVSSGEFEETKKVVAEFGRPGGIGEELQNKLLKRAEEKESWLIDWWNEAAYLGFREPVVVHSNPSVGFPPQAHGDMETFAKMVARMIIATIKWNILIQNHSLPPDMYRQHPMCMMQYDMYSTTRVPAKDVDLSRKTPLPESKHVIVMRNGHVSCG